MESCRSRKEKEMEVRDGNGKEMKDRERPWGRRSQSLERERKRWLAGEGLNGKRGAQWQAMKGEKGCSCGR